MVSGVGEAMMKTLHVFNPRYTESDVMMIDLEPEFPQVDWFVGNALFFIQKKPRQLHQGQDSVLS